MVRDTQAAEQGADEQIPIAPLGAPDEGSMEEERDQRRWRPFISENVASCQRVPVNARASAAPTAITRRTPNRTMIRTATPTAPAAATAESRLARQATDSIGIMLNALPRRR